MTKPKTEAQQIEPSGSSAVRNPRLWLIGGAVVVALIAVLIVVLNQSSTTTAGLTWHPQQESQGRTGSVDGDEATLTRGSGGVSYELNSTSLLAGNAYTVWAVVINNPEDCDPQPCTPGDVLTNPAIDSQVLYSSGAVADGSGSATFTGSLEEGPLNGWFPDRTLDDAYAAEIHLVLNDHGPELDQFMPGMIETYRGGCSDESPFPGIFPATALADGEAGPNTCLLYQSVIFPAS